MKRGKTQFKRLLELDRRIRAGEYPNCLTFGADWEVSQKTVQRDIDFMRDELGAPLVYDRIRKGFRYEDNNWFLPAMSLSEGELTALLMSVRMFEQYHGTPMARHLQSIAEKIQGLLPENISIQADMLFSRFSFTAPPAKPVRDDVWIPVIRGLTNRRIIRLRYRAFDASKAKEWGFSPYHLANLQGEWYVFGSAVGHDDILQLSMARIERATVTDMGYSTPEAFDAKKLVSGSFGRAASGGREFTVRLLFDKAVANWVLERQWHQGQSARVRRDGQVELTFKATGMIEVLRWVLAWGGDVRVLGPKELKEAISFELKRMKSSNTP